MPFLLSEGDWEGEGSVFFPAALLELVFTIRWKVARMGGEIHCEQEVEMMDTQETVRTLLIFTPLTEADYGVTLFHSEAGEVLGNAQIDQDTLSWTLEALEGREVFQKEKECLVRFHAHYGYEELYRREIKGVLRKKQ